MELHECYRELGLEKGAGLTEIKSAYRRLARRYHPDLNLDNPRAAQAQFIKITKAYELLLEAENRPPIEVINQSETLETVEAPPLSPYEQELKASTYTSLQELLKQKRFARAIALIEGLALRLPKDPEVRQWQAITYQYWGRHLINQGQIAKAKIYLKKALRTDPHNRALSQDVQQELQRLETSKQAGR